MSILISVLSQKGGAGKSTITRLLAVEAASLRLGGGRSRRDPAAQVALLDLLVLPHYRTAGGSVMGSMRTSKIINLNIDPPRLLNPAADSVYKGYLNNKGRKAMNSDDAAALEQILRDNNLLLFPPTNIPRPFYPPQYYGAKYSGEALLDTNIFLRAIRLINEEPLDDTSLKAAAVLAFLTLTDFSCDPTMALFELGLRQSHNDISKELELFRVADNVLPQYYIDIARGRSTRLPAEEIEAARLRSMAVRRAPKNVDFTHDIQNRRNAYLVGLQMLYLFLQDNLSELQRAEKFITWAAEEFFFMPVCINWALHDFSPRANSGTRILKKINMNNPQNTKRALLNAAHDAATAKLWLDRVKIDHLIPVFCTSDKSLQRIAGFLFAPAGEAAARSRQFLEELWGPEDGARLQNHYDAEKNRITGGNRRVVVESRNKDAINRIAELETRLGIS